MLDTIIIGAGPSGLAVARELKTQGLNYLVIERKHLGYNIARFPYGMTFFSDKKLLELHGFCLIIPEDKPSREQYLAYLFQFALNNKLNIMDFTEVLSVYKNGEIFSVNIQNRDSSEQTIQAKSIVCACGAFDDPRLLNIEGENLPNVSHYYNEQYPYIGHDVLIIGSGNSAVETALKLYRSGARVTLSHRKKELNPEKIKYWIYPDIQKRLKKGEIDYYPLTHVTKISRTKAYLTSFGAYDKEKHLEINVDFVLALTGYNPPIDFLKSLNIDINKDTNIPVHNPETMETNIHGMFVAGAITGGNVSGKVFIENSRYHGGMMVEQLKKITRM